MLMMAQLTDLCVSFEMIFCMHDCFVVVVNDECQHNTCRRALSRSAFFLPGKVHAVLSLRNGNAISRNTCIDIVQVA